MDSTDHDKLSHHSQYVMQLRQHSTMFDMMQSNLQDIYGHYIPGKILLSCTS